MLHFATDQAITAALAEMDLTAAQGHILGFLSRQSQPPCPRDIEEVFHLSHPTVSGLLRRMEKKDFIAICPDTQDKRCKRIFILPKGEACSRRITQCILQIENQLVQDFSEEEQTLFAQFLDRAVQNMGAQCCHPFHKEDS